jgi:hypothetical protein
MVIPFEAEESPDNAAKYKDESKENPKHAEGRGNFGECPVT